MAGAPAVAAGVGADAHGPAVVEVTAGSKDGNGIFLRCGFQGGQPMYRRLKEEPEPMLLFFSDGNGDQSCAGWYISASPSKQVQDQYLEFWKSEPVLPAVEKGECGGGMEVRAQLDGPALAALAALPEATRQAARAAFTATRAPGEKGIGEEAAAAEGAAP